MLIRELTQGSFEVFDLLDVTDSTNDYLKQYASRGQARIVQAREQTAGRGRGDHRWISTRDEGLYISFLVYPNWSARQGRILNIVGVLTVVESLRSLLPSEPALEAKWPNDVLLDGSKIAGVLVELSTLSEEIQWAVVGIGINVFQREFPGQETFPVPPTSLRLAGVEIAKLESLTRPVVGCFSDLFRLAQQGHIRDLEQRFAAVLSPSEVESR